MPSPCLFCKIAAHEIPVTPLYEDDQNIAFSDLHPQAPTHILFIPKQHFPDITQTPADVLGPLFAAAAAYAAQHHPTGHRILTNTGPDAGQSVPHLHLHLLAGRHLAWPPG